MNKLLLTVFTIFIVAYVTRADSLTNGLIAYYQFNGNANDESGFGRDGIIHGAVLGADRYNSPSKAFNYNGSNNWIAASSPINDVINSFTISIWFKPSNNYTSDVSIPFVLFPSHGETTWSDSSVGVGISAGTNQIKIWEHTHDFLPVVLNVQGHFSSWTHATLVYSNRVPMFYTNGVIAAIGVESSRNPVRPSTGQAMSWRNQEGGIGGGRQVPGDSHFFQGSIDDMRVFNRALSANEVMQLYTYESAPVLNVKTAVYLDSQTLRIGANYQIQISHDLNYWTNFGTVFTATNNTWRTTNYWDVENSQNHFFRLQTSP